MPTAAPTTSQTDLVINAYSILRRASGPAAPPPATQHELTTAPATTESAAPPPGLTRCPGFYNLLGAEAEEEFDRIFSRPYRPYKRPLPPKQERYSQYADLA